MVRGSRWTERHQESQCDRGWIDTFLIHRETWSEESATISRAPWPTVTRMPVSRSARKRTDRRFGVRFSATPAHSVSPILSVLCSAIGPLALGPKTDALPVCGEPDEATALFNTRSTELVA